MAGMLTLDIPAYDTCHRCSGINSEFLWFDYKKRIKLIQLKRNFQESDLIKTAESMS